jgi:uncharacterized membrane protein YhaH (DUF805 family)
LEWYTKVLSNYVGFQGRARRKEYWMFVLFNAIASLVLGIVDAILNLGSILGLLYSLAVFIPSIAVGFRRLHDTNKSGWWSLIVLIPLVGAIIYIVFMCKDSDDSENRYGPSPK